MKTSLKSKQRRHPQYQELHGNYWQKGIGLNFLSNFLVFTVVSINCKPFWQKDLMTSNNYL